MFNFLKQAVKFGLVGLAAAVVDYGFYFILTRLSQTFFDFYVLTSVFTSVLAIGVAYTLNHHWTFRYPNNLSIARSSRYFAVYGVGIIWQNALLALQVETFHIPDLFAKAIAILIVGFCWNFLLARYWVFRYTEAMGEQ